MEWGAHLLDATASGLWSPEESLLSINARELLAVEYGLRHCQLLVSNSTVAVFSDNSTALAYLRKQGGHSIAGPQLHFSEDPLLGRDNRPSPGRSINPGQEQCASGFSVSSEPGPGVNDTAGSEEAPLTFWGPHDSHCSVLAPETMVPGPSRSVVDGPISVPRCRDLLSQPHFHCHHLGTDKLFLHA